MSVLSSGEGAGLNGGAIGAKGQRGLVGVSRSCLGWVRMITAIRLLVVSAVPCMPPHLILGERDGKERVDALVHEAARVAGEW